MGRHGGAGRQPHQSGQGSGGGSHLGLSTTDPALSALQKKLRGQRTIARLSTCIAQVSPNHLFCATESRLSTLIRKYDRRIITGANDTGPLRLVPGGTSSCQGKAHFISFSTPWDEQDELEARARKYTSPYREVIRAQESCSWRHQA